MVQQPPNGETERFVITVSHEPQLVADANRLLAAAEPEGPMSKVLAACASLLFCSALEEAINVRLSVERQQHRAGSERAKAAEQLLSAPLRRRMMDLPKLISSGHITLKWRSAHVQFLHDLITKRNQLCHVKEGQFEVAVGEIKSQETVQRFVSTAQKHPYPWHLIDPAEAKRYGEGVDRYLREVIGVAPDREPSPGEILERAQLL